MNRREALLGVGLGILGTSVLKTADASESKEKDVINTLIDVRSATKLTKAAVSDEDLRTILQVGINAPSAHNVQPWFFAVVSNRETLDEIDEASGFKSDRLSLKGVPVAILACCDDSGYGTFDLGAACGRMADVAVLLGYGVKTIAAPAKVVNEKYKSKLGIPDKYNALVALLIGKEETASVDGVSGATTREPFENKVSFVK